MAVAVAQTGQASTSTAPSVTVSLGSAVTRGTLLWVCVIVASAALPDLSFLFNGVDPGDAYTGQDDSCPGLSMVQQIWNATGDEQFFQVTIGTPLLSWAVLVAAVTNDAHLPPYDVDSVSGTGPDPVDTSPWYAPDDGVVLGVAATPSSVTFTAPTGWTLEQSADTTPLSFGLASDTCIGGHQSPESWGGSVASGTDWLTTVLPFQSILRRIAAATAYASNPGGQLLVDGPLEAPVPVTPFTPDINPLPPLPSDIVVPLPPWVPQPGPYRQDT